MTTVWGGQEIQSCGRGRPCAVYWERGKKTQKNGVCVNADEFKLDVLNLRKGSRVFIEGGIANWLGFCFLPWIV